MQTETKEKKFTWQCHTCKKTIERYRVPKGWFQFYVSFPIGSENGDYCEDCSSEAKHKIAKLYPNLFGNLIK